jgi:glycosyltransferase involved in cell wall biosynthesis
MPDPAANPPTVPTQPGTSPGPNGGPNGRGRAPHPPLDLPPIPPHTHAPSIEASLELKRQPLVHAPGGNVPPVSVIILTFNEQVNVKDCIRSCAWCDDIHVLDSGSTDKTIELAREMGATVHINKFKSFGDQRNWAIDNIPCKHPWHFHLDADERFTPELVAEMFNELGGDGHKSTKAAYLCPSKMMLLGHWLKYSGGYPSYQVRLFRYGKCRYIDFGHGQREDPQGEVGTLAEPYTHYNFSKGVLEWFYKHNDYSNREANEAMVIRAGGMPTLRQRLIGDSTSRRRAWKNFSYFLRGRAIWRFGYNFFIRGGILDGMAGFHYCAMISVYEYWTELKIVERAKPWGEKTQRLVEKMLEEPAADRRG